MQMRVFMLAQAYVSPGSFLKIVPYFFISMGEESGQPTKNANKMIILIILDIHGKCPMMTQFLINFN